MQNAERVLRATELAERVADTALRRRALAAIPSPVRQIPPAADPDNPPLYSCSNRNRYITASASPLLPALFVLYHGLH